jgi:purine-binding chemotaxis protein CheW
VSSDDSGPSSWLLCRAGDRLCALPVEQVVEVMRAQPVEALKGTPDFVRGVSILRGAAVPVVDLAMLFGQPAGSPGRLATISTGTGVVALALDGVIGLRTLPPSAADALPPLVREAAGEAISCIETLDAGLLLRLRAARIVPEAVLALIERGAAAQ